MSFLSSMNPLTYPRKQAAAWNALAAAYTFSLLSENDQQIVIRAADKVARRDFRRSFAAIAKEYSPVVAHNVLAYGFREIGVAPALGKQLWFRVANPFVASIGAEDLLGFTKRQIEKEYGIRLPDLN